MTGPLSEEQLAARRRHDARYKPTSRDVLWALSSRDPDPFGVSEVPWGDRMIGEMIAARWQLGRPTGRRLQMNTLRELLTEMTAKGQLVARPQCEWASLGREIPSRSKVLMYTTKELADRWAAADRERE